MWPHHSRYVPHNPHQLQQPASSPWPNNGNPQRPPIVNSGPPPLMQPNPLKRSFSDRHPPVYNTMPGPRLAEPGHPRNTATLHGIPPQSAPRHPVSHSPGNQFISAGPPAHRGDYPPRYAPKTQSHSPSSFRNGPRPSTVDSLNRRKSRLPDEIDRQTEIFTNGFVDNGPHHYDTPLHRPVMERSIGSPAHPRPMSAQASQVRFTTNHVPPPSVHNSPTPAPSVAVPTIPQPPPQLTVQLTPKFAPAVSVHTSPKLISPAQGSGFRLGAQNHLKGPERVPSPLRQSSSSRPPITEPPRPEGSNKPPSPEPAALPSQPPAPPPQPPGTKATPVATPLVEDRAIEIPLTKKHFQSYFNAKENDLFVDYFSDASICMKRANHISGLDKIETFTNHVQLSKTSPFAGMKSVKALRSSYDEPKPKERAFAHFVLGEHHHNRVLDQMFAYPVHNFKAPAYQIPPYTHYVSSKRNALVEGDKQKTFLPYLGENTDEFDEDYQALEKRILENQEKGRALNESQEFAAPWISKIDAILSELGTSTSAVLKFLIDERITKPPRELPAKELGLFEGREDWITEGFYEEEDDAEVIKGETNDKPLRPQKQWRVAVKNLPTPSGSSLAAAILACWSFMDICGFSLWHVVRQTEFAAKACEEVKPDAADRETNDDDPFALHAYVDQACVICKTHQCYWHGEFSEDEDGHDVRLALTSNFEADPVYDKAQLAERGRDLAHELDVRLLLGSSMHGKVTGEPWTLLSDDPPGIPDDEFCSMNCFWDKANREDYDTSALWSAADENALGLLGPAWAANKRGACVLARLGVMKKTCVDIWFKLINMAPTTEDEQAERDSRGHAHPNKDWKWWIENSKTWRHDQREPFRPCNHVGKCKGNPNCSCYNQNISCEKSCNCPSICSRRFRGCRCAAKHQACVLTETCDCRQLNRECDPDLCGNCGAHEVLDPVNRYNDKITKGRCGNVAIQRAVPKSTHIGHSKLLSSGGISGWGLFVGEDIRPHEYIGEYIGEIVTPEESEQRGIIYNAMNLSYLFDLNSKQVLDSTPIGNKLRYINHQGDNFANCQAKVMFCGGVQRIGMFATKRIKLGDELLFNYGDGFASKIDMVKMVDDQGTVAIEKAKKGVEASAKTSAHKKLPAQKPKPVVKPGKGKKKADVISDDEAVDDDDAMAVDEADEDVVSSGDEDVAMEEEDEEDEEEEEEVLGDDDDDDDDEEVFTPKPKSAKPKAKGGAAAAFKTKKTTPSDRMRKAWISRYRNLGLAHKAKEQDKKYKKMQGTGKRTRDD